MTSKRQLKKFIRRTCGDFAAEILIARYTFSGISTEKVHEILLNLAKLQEATLAKVNVAFDHAPAKTEPSQYRKLRRAYYHKAYTRLMEEFMQELDVILKEMNAAMPENVKKILKEAAAEA